MVKTEENTFFAHLRESSIYEREEKKALLNIRIKWKPKNTEIKK